MTPKIYLSVFISVLICIICSTSAGIVTPCKPGDYDCQTNSAKEFVHTFASGIPAIELASLDPLVIEKIESNDHGLNMKFSNVVITGLKDVEINSVKMNAEKSKLQFTLTDKLLMKGDYTLSGRLLVLPVEGNGKFSIDSHKIRTEIVAELAKKTTDDGREYWQIIKYTTKNEPLDIIVFDFKNLFNGNQQLSDATHSFANANYKEVLSELGAPVLDTLVKRIVKHINKFLKKVPKEELYLN